MIGPIPDSPTTAIASGTTNGRNAGGPTETWVPVIASEMSGKNVSQKITERERHEHEVLEQEDGLAGEQRIQLRPPPRRLLAPPA